MLQTGRVKGFLPENFDDQKGALNFTIYRRLQTGKDQYNRLSKEKGCKDHGEAPEKSKFFDVLSQEKQPNTKIRASSRGNNHSEAPANSKTLEVLLQENHHNSKFRASSPGKYSGEAP